MGTDDNGAKRLTPYTYLAHEVDEVTDVLANYAERIVRLEVKVDAHEAADEQRHQELIRSAKERHADLKARFDQLHADLHAQNKALMRIVAGTIAGLFAIVAAILGVATLAPEAFASFLAGVVK